jgi:hypothetical protein
MTSKFTELAIDCGKLAAFYDAWETTTPPKRMAAYKPSATPPRRRLDCPVLPGGQTVRDAPARASEILISLGPVQPPGTDKSGVSPLGATADHSRIAADFGQGSWSVSCSGGDRVST